MRKNSVKYSRVNAAIVEEVSRIIRTEMKDPRIAVVTSVTGAEVSTDLKECRIFISVLGSEEEKKETIDALERGEGFIRRELAHSLNLRNTPYLHFKLDESIEYGVRMSEIIDKVKKQDEEKAAAYAGKTSNDEEEGRQDGEN
ncbi:MAG: 30S ribosome-binding factor RbfA [Eubacterium sp.]|nr:30S ribosome-binding factor RbfA [Eubacterium sp.]